MRNWLPMPPTMSFFGLTKHATAIRRERTSARGSSHETQLSATLDAEPISDEQIEVQLDAAALDDALAQVLSELPPPLHQLFSLHYQEELTIPQVAEIVGIPEGTVKSRLHKTMNIIRKKLKRYEHH